jgi:hypothetical protein
MLADDNLDEAERFFTAHRDMLDPRGAELFAAQLGERKQMREHLALAEQARLANSGEGGSELTARLAHVDAQDLSPERAAAVKQLVIADARREAADLARQQGGADQAAADLVADLGDQFTDVLMIPGPLRRAMSPKVLDQRSAEAAGNKARADGIVEPGEDSAFAPTTDPKRLADDKASGLEIMAVATEAAAESSKSTESEAEVTNEQPEVTAAASAHKTTRQIDDDVEATAEMLSKAIIEEQPATERTKGESQEILVVGDQAERNLLKGLSEDEFEAVLKLRNDFDRAFNDPEEPASVAPPPQAPPPPSPPTSRRQPAQELGVLSAFHETGGRGVSTVSTGMTAGGKHDPGGVSYGSYQLTSQTPVNRSGVKTIAHDGGRVRNFLLHEGRPWASEFGTFRPGTAAFSDVWRGIARRVPQALHRAEHTYIKRSHYDPAVGTIRSVTGIDIDAMPFAIQNAVWSTSVQHGPGYWKNPSKRPASKGASLIIIDAILNADRILKRDDPRYDSTLVANIYTRRTEYWPATRSRYIKEARDALKMLDR